MTTLLKQPALRPLALMVSALLAALTPLLLDALVGLVAGVLVLSAVTLVKRMKAGPAPRSGR